MLAGPETQKLRAKGFLATGQRVPGLGNGVLQDILWSAKIHPKSRVSAWSESDQECLFQQVKAVLSAMAELGGRDTEKDLFGNEGGYKTVMSKNTAGHPCPVCGGMIQKENYMGGSIYYCAGCQTL
jgi:formamidopyrimidine-DNA glycosylase